MRRSSPQSKVDERAYPVRVLLRAPPGGWLVALGPTREPFDWIRQHLGLGNATIHTWRSPHTGEGHALYCRSVDDAARFLAAFPEFELADGTVAQTYTSPHVSQGRR